MDDIEDYLEQIGVEADENLVEHVFTNDKTNPGAANLFYMLYQAAACNKLGVMHAKNRITGAIDTLIVGVELGDGDAAIWPLARLLKEDEHGNYLAPDGEGGYVGDTTH